MAWSIFAPSQGGGDPQAVAWAKSLLQQIGAPVTAGNVRFVYQWERSEGGGGTYNPLNQGPDPSHPELSGGTQYGGGASDYHSWAAGLQGAADYLAMPNYAKVKADLMADNAGAARADLIASPWAAGHYGYGSAWSAASPPGVDATTVSAIPSIPGLTTPELPGLPSLIPGTHNPLPGASSSVAGSIASGVTAPLIKWADTVALRAALVITGAVLILVGLARMVDLSSSAAPARGGSASARRTSSAPARRPPAGTPPPAQTIRDRPTRRPAARNSPRRPARTADQRTADRTVRAQAAGRRRAAGAGPFTAADEQTMAARRAREAAARDAAAAEVV